jgi:hypothetical protein
MPDEGGPLLTFNGAADLGPDGTEFQVPVSVTFPSNTPLTPGARYPIFRYDEADKSWMQTQSIATVSADGQSFSAEITHFSLNGGDGSLGEGGCWMILRMRWVTAAILKGHWRPITTG